MGKNQKSGKDLGPGEELAREITASYDAEKMEQALENVQDAQQMINDAIDMLEYALHYTPNSGHFKAYVVDHLKIMASEDSGFMSRDTNLDNWIKELQDAINKTGEFAEDDED